MKNLGIKYQLRMIVILPILLISTLFASVYIYQYQQLIIRQTTMLRIETMHQLLPFIRYTLLHPNEQVVTHLLKQAMLSFSIRTIAIYNQQGNRILYQGDPAFSPLAVSKKQKNKLFIPIKRHEFMHESLAPFFTIPSMSKAIKDTTIGWLYLEINPQPAFMQRYLIQIITLLLFICAIVIAFISSIFLMTIYKPINRLRRSMKQILKNEFETQIKHSTSGEIGIIEAGCVHLQTNYLVISQEMNNNIEQATHDLQQGLLLLEEKNIQLSLEKKKSDERSRNKSEFIASMSHEIRTPMNGIIGFSSLLLEHKLTPLQHDYVKTIKASATEMLTIINNILDYSKIDAGKLQLDHIPTNLRACIDEVFAILIPHAQQKNLVLIALTNRKVPDIVLGDPWRLKQILRNLVSNAIKFTDRGHIVVKTQIIKETKTDYTLQIAVIDTGIGLSAEDQLTLFSAYQQADTNIHRNITGSGLGLVICKQLIENMQGKINLISTPNQGSTFSIVLKLDKLMAYEKEKYQTHEFGSITVLCFDTNQLSLDSLVETLSHWNICCINVTTEAGFKQALMKNPNAAMAFVAIEVPKPQHEIVSLLNNNNIPCIIMSTTFIADPAELGAHDVIAKPCNTQKLQEIIESLIHSKNTLIRQKNNISPDLLALRLQLQQKRPRLLIAEDNIINQQLFNSLLDPARIHLVNNGNNAILYSDDNHYSLILLDVNMPECGGLEAAQHIRQHSLLNMQTPIILISATQIAYSPATLKKYGILACLQKPIDEQTLLKTILQTIEKPLYPAIDWDLCIQKLSGNTNLAHDFMAQFVAELPANRAEFLQLKRDQNIIAMEKAAHKLHGACCFCGVPILQQCVSTLEIRAKHAKHMNELEEALIQLIDAIDAVINAYKDKS